MVDAVDQILEYVEAWNEPDPDSCRELLARSVTAEVELVHPTFGRARGIETLAEHIAGYEAAMPDTRVALTRAIDAHNQIARYAWKLQDIDGNTVVAGIDVVETAADGRLARILLFDDRRDAD
jgi:hypothetical protein